MFVSFAADTSILLRDTGPRQKTIDNEIHDLAQPPHQLLDGEHDGVLAFKLTPTIPTGTVNLTMQFNGTQFFDSRFGPLDSTTRTWHEIIHVHDLHTQNNKVHIEANFADVASADTGKVTVELSDFVLSYHANVQVPT
jgi:hypothetical protein